MIEIKDIEFGYRSKNILHNISFDMNEGHCIAILGVNGAGKSTLIKCLNRINPVHKGAVMIENSNILQIHLNEVAKKIAYVAQKNEVSKLTVYDAILLGRKPYIKWDVTKQDKETTLGERLKCIRKANKLTQIQFAQMVGIGQTHISKIEKNIEHPSETLLILISILFGIRITWIKEGTGRPKAFNI